MVNTNLIELMGGGGGAPGKEQDWHAFTYGAIIPIIVAFGLVPVGQYDFGGIFEKLEENEQPVKALVVGLIVGLITFGIKKLFPTINNSSGSEENILSKAVLLGLLAAEVIVFVNDTSKITMGTITLFLFFYYHSVEHL